MLHHFLSRKILGFVVQRPAQQQEVIDDRIRQIADFAVEIDNHGIERLGRRHVADAGRDLRALVVHPLEFQVLQVLRDLSLGELLRAAGLGHIRQVSVFRQRVAERLGNENLPRCVREMLDGADDVRDFEIVVIDDAREVVETRAVGPLDDVVLLFVPVKHAEAANLVGENTLALAGHFHSHDLHAPLGLKLLGLLVRRGHPAAAIKKRLFFLLRRLALRFELLRRPEIAICQPLFEQRFHRGLIPV